MTDGPLAKHSGPITSRQDFFVTDVDSGSFIVHKQTMMLLKLRKNEYCELVQALKNFDKPLGG